MLIIGLTGSIATGKSTVSRILSQPPYSLPIIDADLLARKVVEPGTPGYRAILKHFLPTTPDLLVPVGPDMPEDGPDGKGRPINRPVLGRRVFGDGEEETKNRKVLNGIVHPAVRWEMFKAVMKAYFQGYQAVVLDVPLLFESRLDRFCGSVVVVAVSDPETQLARLRARDPHLTEEDARRRVISQGDVREKATRAETRGKGRGAVVWNDGDREDLKREVDKVVKELLGEGVTRGYSPRWWAWLLWGCPPLAAAVAAWEYNKNQKANKDWERERAKL